MTALLEPTEPITDAMIEAGVHEYDNPFTGYVQPKWGPPTLKEQVVARIYRAMLAAAPQEPDDDAVVVKAALVSIVASGVQRKLRPSQIVTEILADETIATRLQAKAPETGEG